MNQRKYKNIHGHMQHHKVKDWMLRGVKDCLLRGARHEEAHTIGAAVRDIPERRLIRRLARALARG